MKNLDAAPRDGKRQSSSVEKSRASYGTAGTTEERAAKEVMGDGKAATLWREAAIKACYGHLVDLHEEHARSQAAKRLAAK